MVKVLVKTYRIPIVLLIMGPILLIASSLKIPVRYITQLNLAAWTFIFLGLAAWLLSELARIMRRASFQARRYSTPTTSQTPRRGRPY